jgi:hypothetical protein
MVGIPLELLGRGFPIVLILVIHLQVRAPANLTDKVKCLTVAGILARGALLMLAVHVPA